MKKLTGFDGVRAFACLFVMIHHICQRIELNLVPKAVTGIMKVGLYGNLGVSIFFVLSGALLSYPFWVNYFKGAEIPSARTYALRRFMRISPGFYISLIVSFLLSIFLFKSPFNLQYCIRQIAAIFYVSDFHYVTFFPSNVNGPLWSISFEVTSYVILYFAMTALFKLFKRESERGAALFLILLTALTLGLHFLFLRFYPIPQVDNVWKFGIIGLAMIWMPGFNPVSLFSHFLLGIIGSAILAWMVKKEQKKHWIFDSSIVLLWIGMILFIKFYTLPRWNTYEIFMNIPYYWPLFPGAIAVTLVCLHFSSYLGRIVDNPFFVFTAKISFGLYIWHFLIMEVLQKTLFPGYRQMQGENFTHFIIASVLTVLLSYGIASLSWFYFEKPILNWAHGRKK